MGLTSRDGIVPLFLDKDIGGPMARTVEDAVAIFDVIAGHDPADPVTAASQGNRADRYMKFLDKDGVRGMRLGVGRQLFTPQNTDPDVMKRMEQVWSEGSGPVSPSSGTRPRSGRSSAQARARMGLRGEDRGGDDQPGMDLTARGASPRREGTPEVPA